ncbi:hypothetical protein AN403_3591 [Pseudomonas fluorescens]|uniref:Uncharacterized protein n=1 Tax=Pseudomonas fluorescens TaxID=294 RepID=A0A0P8ZN24_PSEFL|nr:hypothetical protein AN403_3591 [Pseudomonas fluorescens]
MEYSFGEMRLNQCFLTTHYWIFLISNLRSRFTWTAMIKLQWSREKSVEPA